MVRSKEPDEYTTLEILVDADAPFEEKLRATALALAQGTDAQKMISTVIVVERAFFCESYEQRPPDADPDSAFVSGLIEGIQGALSLMPPDVVVAYFNGLPDDMR